MKSFSKAAAMILLGASAAWAQTASPSMASKGYSRNPRAVMANSNGRGLAQSQEAQNAMRHQVEDMGTTLTKMHALLKDMQAKNKVSGRKDPMIKANLEMWGLMLQDLDKQFEQLRVAARSREEIEARRAALYRQAQAKAAAEAQGVQAPGFTRTPVPGAPGAEVAAPGTPETKQAVPAEPSAQPAQPPASAPANPSSSPN